MSPAISTGRVARALFWTALESGGLCALSFGTLVVLSHFLTPAEFGIGAVTLAVVQILNIPVEMLFHDALVQRDTVEDRHYDTAFAVSFVVGAALSGLCWALAPGFARIVHEPMAGPALAWMSLSLPISGLGCAIMARLRRELQFRPLAVRSLTGRAVGAVASIVLAASGAGVWSLVVQQVAIQGIAIGTVWMIGGRRPHFRFEARAFAELFGFGLRAVAVLGVFFAMQRVFLLLAGLLLGASAAGYLNMAFRTVDMLRDLLASAVSQLILPVFARLQGDRSRLESAYESAVETTAALGFPVFLGLFATAPDFVPLIFGREWLPAVPFVQVVALAAIPFFCRMFSAPAMTALGAPHGALASAIPDLALIIIGMITIGRHSELHASLLWLGRQAVTVPLDTIVLRHFSGLGIAAQYRGIPLLVALGAAMVAAVTLVGEALPAGLAPALRLALLVAIGALAYPALLWLMRPALCGRLLGLAGMAVRAERSPRETVPMDA